MKRLDVCLFVVIYNNCDRSSMLPCGALIERVVLQLFLSISGRSSRWIIEWRRSASSHTTCWTLKLFESK